jgi:hypothetical protein
VLVGSNRLAQIVIALKALKMLMIASSSQLYESQVRFNKPLINCTPNRFL